jgi:hypothetical protein
MGRHEDARELMRRIDAHAEQHYMSPGLRAVVHGALGDIEGGVALLREAVDKKDLYLLAARPLLEREPLLKDPRAQQILEDVGALAKTR